MANISKRDKEKYYFEMFCKDYPLPDGIVKYGDKPDVILKGERTIGIEITNFFLKGGTFPESEQVQRGVRDKVVATAQRIYQKKNTRKLKIEFGFNSAVPIRDQNKVAKKIADLAARVETRQTGQLPGDAFQGISELSFVYLIESGNEDGNWRVGQVYKIPLTPLWRLKEIIKTKEERLQDYIQCDAYWLLIVVDFMDSAQDQEIQIDGFDAAGSSLFEKVLVYKTCFGQVCELKTTAR